MPKPGVLFARVDRKLQSFVSFYIVSFARARFHHHTWSLQLLMLQCSACGCLLGYVLRSVKCLQGAPKGM